MKAPPFAYVRAASLADVFRLWREAGPEAKLLAGGQTPAGHRWPSGCPSPAR